MDRLAQRRCRHSSGEKGDRTLLPSRLAIVVAASLVILNPLPARSQTAAPRIADIPDPWSAFIAEAAERFAIPTAWIRSVMRVESGGNAKAVSPRGAVGLMQIMPATYAELRARYALGDDPTEPRDNIMAGAAYLREMYDRFGASGFLAAYNLGPERYREHLATGSALPEETRTYVTSLAPLLSGTLLADVEVSTSEPRNWQKAGLFVSRSARQSGNISLSFAPQSLQVKADRGVVDRSVFTPASRRLVRQANSDAKQAMIVRPYCRASSRDGVS